MTLADDPDGKRLVDAVDAHAEERRHLFVAGFARFVIDRGSGALAPTKDSGGKSETWQAVGRRLYGVTLFNDTLQRELAARKEQANATRSVPAVRGRQSQIPQGRQAASSGKE